MLSKLEFTPSENAKYGIYFVIILIGCIMLYFQTIRPLSIERAALDAKILANTQLLNYKLATQNQDYDALLKIQNLKLAQAKKLPDKIAVPDLISEYASLQMLITLPLLVYLLRIILKLVLHSHALLK